MIKQIEDEENEVGVDVVDGKNKFLGMFYVEGVLVVLCWVIGVSDEKFYMGD